MLCEVKELDKPGAGEDVGKAVNVGNIAFDTLNCIVLNLISEEAKSVVRFLKALDKTLEGETRDTANEDILGKTELLTCEVDRGDIQDE